MFKFTASILKKKTSKINHQTFEPLFVPSYETDNSKKEKKYQIHFFQKYQLIQMKSHYIISLNGAILTITIIFNTV